MAKSVNIQLHTKGDEQWMSATDLMSALMLIFMLIALAFMISAATERDSMKEERDDIKKVALKWAEIKEKTYQALIGEFENDLSKWHAMIDRKELIVRFREPKILFAVGESSLTPRFTEILRDFFPRYVRVLGQFSNHIAEIRIEGHTSSEWNESVSSKQAYFKNLVLSHDRSREVVIFCLSTLQHPNSYEWSRQLIVAAGMSSSRPIMLQGQEDKEESRRVDFRVRTNAEERLSEIMAF
uniref:Outer membrane protein OmpA n=1 Tax=Candidatus Kentrum sp. DK TaxID=2126562 RepID=A0A450ST60_9GAMM|nr:MAG: Outer membrane protein OmpA [Candidatus Kentron sp. DK]